MCGSISDHQNSSGISNTRRKILQSVGGGLALGLAGCSANGSNGGSGSSNGDTTRTRNQTKPIKVGVMTDLSGSLAQLGKAQKIATKIARDEINNAGGVNGRDIELIIRDEETKPSVGVRRAQELIQQENVDFIAGPLSSAVSLAVRDVVDRNQVPTQSPAAGSRALAAGQCSKYFFMFQMNNEGFAAASAQWMRKNLGKTMEIMYMDFDWGQNLNKFMTTNFEKAGGTVTSHVALPLDTSDMSSYLSKINTDSDIFFAAVTGSQTVPLLNQAQSFGIQDKMNGIGQVNFSNYNEVNSKARDGWHSMTPYPSFSVGPWDNELNNQFRQKFKSKYGSGAWSHPAMSYSQLHFFANAAQKSGFTDLSDKDGLISQMERMKVKRSFSVASAPGLQRANDHGMYAITPILEGKADGPPTVAKTVPYKSFIDKVPDKCKAF